MPGGQLVDHALQVRGASGDDLEAPTNKLLHSAQHLRLVAILDGHEQRAAFRQRCAFAELRLDESGREIPINSHNFARALHFR